MKVSSLLKKIVMITGDLPTLPQTGQIVMQKLSDPEVDIKELEKIIMRDPSLTSRILKIANSPFYGRPRTIKTISEATVVIGLSTLKSIVIASALREMLKNFGLTEKLLWEHALATAFITRYLAEKLCYRNIEEAFLAGLLHDIGKIVLQLRVPDRMYLVMQDVYHGENTNSIEVEMEVFGFTHAHVGQLVARKWQFAVEIEETIGYHHWPGRASVDPMLAHLTHLANIFSHKMEVGPIRTPDVELSETVSAKYLKLSDEQVNDYFQECTSKIQSEKEGLLS
ncbi:MAG TPA: HDOD domain-containing protein [Thermodesulforhabdus norvegica]|uniref:HDOD domain-containing protein n=1 Tax=Thermodesulforhabdus norvegica TaxID=39841 RepID=A0A7C1AXU3_9BACT|nr:HDOD domain-containing protein [Deltaproteobacteria bacterium]MBW2069068.1 HDOD domain-containing protein [Deltaproteobacteria bacterium]HDL89708.1 HDOD domain-containing protein [Thermodesulforhabdus norvegica]